MVITKVNPAHGDFVNTFLGMPQTPFIKPDKKIIDSFGAVYTNELYKRWKQQEPSHGNSNP
jgi:hypothetical protein